MIKPSEIIQGSNYSRGYNNRDYTYTDYSLEQKNVTWKQQLDEEYAYRRALEAKYGKDALKNNQQAIESMLKFKDTLEKRYLKEAEKRERESRKKILEEYKKEGILSSEEKEELKLLRKQDSSERFKDFGKQIGQSVASSIASVLKNINSKVDTYIGVFNDYAAGITTRLQGSDKTFQSIADSVSGKLAGSPVVKQTAVIEKLNELVSSGVNYNVEQRAFLSAITDQMVQTFDVANGTLLRIIRLQQADSTIARMGMESLLNKYLNATYQDTSYLTNVYDTVEGTLVDAISQLGREAGTEFEYVAQKWLGSLYSVGMSESTLTSIAEGINYIASGNVTGLTQNSALQNLLVMGASRAGLNYGSLLTGGVDSKTLNKLLYGVTSYAQGIAGIDNLVVKNQYAQLFGLTMSDLTALLQMGDDLSYVINQTLAYSDAVRETSNQLATMADRLPLAKKVSNVFENVIASVSENIATNTGLYVTWLVTDLVEQATGGINIPSLPFGINLNTNVTDLIRTGLVGGTLLGQIGNVISSLSNGFNNTLYGWGESDYTSRGSGFTGITSGVRTTTSQSLAVGNASGSDIASSAITQATTEAQQSVTGKETSEQDMMDEIRNNVVSIYSILKAVFDDNNSLRVSVSNYGLTNTNVNTSVM